MEPKGNRFCFPAAVVGTVADVVVPDDPVKDVAVPDASVEAAAVDAPYFAGVPTAFASEAAAIECDIILGSTFMCSILCSNSRSEASFTSASAAKFTSPFQNHK